VYAVIRTGGKQYRVETGQRLLVESLPGGAGDTVELSDVLLIGSEGSVTVGTPNVADARVVAEIVAQGRSRKINVFKYKSKIRYRRLIGHRQPHTELTIREIVGPEGPTPKTKPRRARRRATPKTEAPTPPTEAEAPAAVSPAEDA